MTALDISYAAPGARRDRIPLVQGASSAGTAHAFTTLADALDALASVDGFPDVLDGGRPWRAERQSWVDDLDEEDV